MTSRVRSERTSLGASAPPRLDREFLDRRAELAVFVRDPMPRVQFADPPVVLLVNRPGCVALVAEEDPAPEHAAIADAAAAVAQVRTNPRRSRRRRPDVGD